MVRNHHHRLAFTLFAGVIVLWVAAMVALMRQSALGDDATGQMIVVFEPAITRDQAFVAITTSGARIVRDTAFDFIWVIAAEKGATSNLKSLGALGTYRELPISPTIAGCVAVADAKVSQAFSM
jgi:hypothetical protein